MSTACASGATAIQLGVEAIRRGEAARVLSIGTDGSVTAEALVRFSLLSALSTQNGTPTKAAKPFSKDRDGFVMAEGSAALVMESLESATKRGAKMERWQALLEAGIAGITGTALERNVDSLFTTGAPQGMSGASGLDDWEVIAWFPVLPPE